MLAAAVEYALNVGFVMIRALLLLQIVLLAIVFADRVLIDPTRIDASAESQSPADARERSSAVSHAASDVARDEATRNSVRLPFRSISIW